MATTPLTWPSKDPGDVKDYDIDWSRWLASVSPNPPDAIATSAFTVVQGSVAIQSQAYSGTIAKVWLTGGTAGETVLIRNTITTVAGRTELQTVSLTVATR